MSDLPAGIFQICGKYRLRTKIASSSFGVQHCNPCTTYTLKDHCILGDVYYTYNVITGEGVAIKMESFETDHPMLDHKWSVYKALGPGEGIPQVLWFGCERNYRALVMGFLGPSLEELFIKCNCRFSLKTVLMLANKLVSYPPTRIFKHYHDYHLSNLQISLIEYIHKHNYVHCNIKPDNFLVDLHHQSCISIIDFGLANKYRNGPMSSHIHYQTGKALTGTPHYASINAHYSIEQTRRDDLESLAYVLIYFLLGSLPWQCLDASQKWPRYHRILQQKLKALPAELCSHLPNEF